ncbi:MAG: TolC family protein [Chitinophagaceae bacterium]
MHKKFFIFLLCLLGISMARAQTNFSSLEELWHYADSHNIQLKTAEAEKIKAGTNVKQAYGGLLPTVTANGSYTDNMKIQSTLIPSEIFNPAAAPGTFTEVTFGRRFIYNGNIVAQLDLLNTEDWFSVKLAKLNNELAALNISQARQDLYKQLANAWFSSLLLAEAENISRENVRVCTSIHEVAKNKFNEGTISEITVNTALINKEKAERNLNVAVQNKLVQINNLRSLLNIKDSISLPVSNTEKNAAIADGTFTSDPSVQLAYTQMQLAKSKWQSSKAAFFPTLSAYYQYNTQIAADNFMKFSNSNTLPQQYWGLRLSMPVFAGNARRFQMQNAKVDYALRQEQYESSRLQAGISDQNLLITYNSSLGAYQKSKNILSLYRRNDEHAQKRLQEGMISLDERLRSYSDLITSQNEYLQSMSDYFIQQYSLKIRQTNLIP